MKQRKLSFNSFLFFPLAENTRNNLERLHIWQCAKASLESKDGMLCLPTMVNIWFDKNGQQLMIIYTGGKKRIGFDFCQLISIILIQQFPSHTNQHEV